MAKCQSIKKKGRQLSVLLWFQNGPLPIQLVVVMAVRKAVSAATMTFTAISTMLFFFIIQSSRLVGVASVVVVGVTTTAVFASVATIVVTSGTGRYAARVTTLVLATIL